MGKKLQHDLQELPYADIKSLMVSQPILLQLFQIES